MQIKLKSEKVKTKMEEDMRLNRKGQSVLEYVIILTVIVGAILLASTKFASSNRDTGIGKVFGKAADKITDSGTLLPGVNQ